uniref:Uncharacterized protein n=1 Tax=Xiphophorus maculatus TaxID=8083 RepID=A0A3B5RAT7_XIPMA
MELAEEQSEKHSWECYATERDNRGTECVSPCRWHRVLHHLPEDGPVGDLLQQADRRVDPMFLLMDLPNFPVLLVLGKMICWEDYLVRLWSRRSGGYLPRLCTHGLSTGDHVSVSRTLCGALIFPSIASLVGRLLFRLVTSNLQCTILGGGIAFVLIKGVLKVYFKQQQYIMQANYPERHGNGIYRYYR